MGFPNFGELDRAGGLIRFVTAHCYRFIDPRTNQHHSVRSGRGASASVCMPIEYGVLHRRNDSQTESNSYGVGRSARFRKSAAKIRSGFQVSGITWMQRPTAPGETV